MNISRKKAIALASVLCVAFSSLVSCLDKNSGKTDNKNDSSSATAAQTAGDSVQQTTSDLEIDQIKNADGAVVGTPFQSGSLEDFAETGMPMKDDLDAADPTSKEPATEIVEVTEANGEKATDADGQTVTEVVTKAPSADDYVSKTDKRYCLWIDISPDPDKEKEYKGVPITADGYAFNDQIIKVTFKIKENIPEKSYAVRFNPDFSSLRGVSQKPKVIQGEIRVGSEIAAQDVSGEQGFVAYGDNISAKAGETVDYYINLKNNPGLAAMLLWVYYDSNAMEVQSITAAGDYAKIARGTEMGKN